MRTMINYLRSLFCKHEWIINEHWSYYKGIVEKEGLRVSMYCKKCGYHKSFWKY